MFFSISDSQDTGGESPCSGSNRSSLALSLAVWGACLGVLLAASVCLGFPTGVPTPGVRAALEACVGACYLAVFSHCLMRLVYSRWPSWLLFTAGFGGLTVSSLFSVFAAVGMTWEPAVLDRLEALHAALLPACVFLFVLAANGAHARHSGLRAGSWRSHARVGILLAALAAAWQLGALRYAVDVIAATKIDVALAVDIASALVLLVLVCRAPYLAVSRRDEIIVPVSYWAVAQLMGSALALGIWGQQPAPWWQVGGLELAGIAALLVGLSSGNERAHRDVAEKIMDLQAMQHISWSLVGASDIDELCAALARAISEGFDAQMVAVYLGGDSGEELVVAATHGIDDNSVSTGKVWSILPARRPGFHNGHTARAYAGGKTEVVPEIFSDVEFMPWRSVARHEGMVVSTPIPYKERTIGVINLFMPGATSVPEGRIAFLEAVAAAVSPAIENARLRPESADDQIKAA